METNDNRECTRLCWEARHSCQETLFRHCLLIGGVHMDEPHVKLMVDCMQACQAAADFMTRRSIASGLMTTVCGEICDLCAQSCERIGDEAMMRCANACRTCARSCREMERAREAA